jgi:hypothetical protein
MNLPHAAKNALPWVKAKLNYLAPTSERPRTYTFDPPAGVPHPTGVSDPHEVVIINLRRVFADLTLDQEGFGLVRHKSAVRDFYNDEEVRHAASSTASRPMW